MVTQEYTYAYGAVSVINGELDSLILSHVNSYCMQVFLDEVASRHPEDRIIMILDGAGWHTAGSLTIPVNMKLFPLPPYAPELDPMEHLWDDLREKWFHNRVFETLDALEDYLEGGLRTMETDKDRVRSIVSWPWIINGAMN